MLRVYKPRQLSSFSACACKMWIGKVLGLFVVLVSVQWCAARIEPMTYLPPDLQENFDTCYTGNLTTEPGELHFWHSMQQFVSRFVQYKQMSREEERFVYDTVGSSLAPLYRTQGNRGKRQAVGPPRIRKEIRTMRRGERVQYFNALNRLKHDRRLQPNVYDALAAFHEGEMTDRAHFGPGFPGWHRIYLFIVESFLRQWNPRVTIPYWASVMDNNMQDPTQSVLFSDAFFGPGVGLPTSGPFRRWQRANPNTIFRRAVGGGGLYTYDGIQRILSRRFNWDILTPTNWPDSSFELQHGGTHVFVGGTMNDLNGAARDPLFFSHHSFVDEIWERFRFRQRAAGVATATDYPWDPNDFRFRRIPLHHPNASMGFFRGGELLNVDYRQISGYDDVFFNLVQYDPVPSCPGCANSPYLRCNGNLNPPQCVPLTIGEMRGSSNRNLVDNLPGILPTGSGPVRKKRQARLKPIQEFCSKRPLINDYDVNVMLNIPPQTWAYVPVKVVTKRPVGYHGFKKYSLYGLQNNHNGLKNVFVTSGNVAGYSTCDKRMSDAGKIKIVAYGLNHYAYSQEFVITDNRLGISESSGVIQVKMPAGKITSELMVAAFDECGRICKPYCKQGTSIHNGDQGFKGGIRVTAQSPTQYSSTYGDALLGMWNIPSEHSCPSLDMAQVPLSFFCEYTDAWLWDSDSPTPPRHVLPTAIPRPLTTYGPGGGGQPTHVCVVSPTCTVMRRCGDCQDWSSQPCSNGWEVAVCVDGGYSMTTVWANKHKAIATAKL